MAGIVGMKGDSGGEKGQKGDPGIQGTYYHANGHVVTCILTLAMLWMPSKA